MNTYECAGAAHVHHGGFPYFYTFGKALHSHKKMVDARLPQQIHRMTIGDRMGKQSTFLVFGATGQTGQHFVSLALEEGHKVRALVRNPEKLSIRSRQLKLQKGSIADDANIDELLQGVDFVVSMLGDAKLQRHDKINTAFVKKLVPAMRR